MDKTKFYKEKTGNYLGRFLFAFPDEPEGAGRGRIGTLYYFTPDIAYSHQNCTIKFYKVYYDLKNPELPDDIEETEQQ